MFASDHDQPKVVPRRDQILSAVAFASNAFLRSARWKDALDSVLSRLGKAARANRAYFFRNSIRDDGELITSQIAEWCAAGIEPQFGNPDLQEVPYVEAGMGRWVEKMAQRQPIHGLIGDFPSCEQELLESQGIQSLLAMPVFCQEKFIGFLGFDDCECLREWSPAELDALSAAATALGAAIDRQDLEQQLRFAQKMEAVGRLASGLAHDFNNVLQAIVGLTSLAKGKLDQQHAAHEDLEEVLQASERAVSLTRQLLVFSRKQDPDFQPVDLRKVCESVATMVTPMLGTSIELTVDVADPSRTILADAGLLSQVLVNLCLNARDAMPAGGKLEIRCKQMTLGEIARLGGEPSADYACIHVRDTGYGMAADVKERVFEPFFTTKKNGTGLGLSVAFETVNKCGGFIDVESTPNEGSNFRICIPLAEQSPCEPNRVEAEKSGSETILVVDDEYSVRETMRRLLVSKGFRVLTADNGRSGLEAYQKYIDEIDVVLTDSLMPEMDGGAMIESMIQLNPAAKAIMFSGCGVSLSETLQRMNTIVLQKPILIDALTREIRSVLDSTKS